MITREFTIYKIENQQNGRVYIGCTEKGERRIKQHFYDLRSGKHKSKIMQTDFNNGDAFRAVAIFAFSATVSGWYIDSENSFNIAATAHAIEKYYIKTHKADTQGYNNVYYAYLYNGWDKWITPPENALQFLTRHIKQTAIKDFCNLYPTKDNPEKVYKPIDLYFSKESGIKSN